jgi:glucose 1-dehydrogenase
MRAIVTGVSAGIGGAICAEIARNCKGASIALCVRRESPYVEQLADELAAAGAKSAILIGDLKDATTAARLVEEAAAAFGGLDTLISNAGGVDPGPLMELTVDRFNKLMNLNCLATLLLAQASYEYLKTSKGTLVAVSSAAGAMPARGTAAYGPSKAALTMLCRQLAHEWNEDGIRVNVVSPGLVRTPINESLFRDDEILRKRIDLIPIHRIGEPFDVARAVWYLASPENRYTTGLDLLVDGGLCSSILGHIPGAPQSKG